MFSKSVKPVIFAETHYKEYEHPVNPHLSADLKDLEALRRRGDPISVANAESLYYDGEVGDIEVPLDRKRGVDINDLWNDLQDHKKAGKKLGVTKVTKVQQKGVS